MIIAYLTCREGVETISCSQLLSHLWLDVQLFPYIPLKKLLLMFKEYPGFRHSYSLTFKTKPFSGTHNLPGIERY